MRSRVVIGLMGGDEQLGAAAQIGAAIASAGEILLTGAPIGTANSTRIHQVAMREASRIATARLIGIDRFLESCWNSYRQTHNAQIRQWSKLKFGVHGDRLSEGESYKGSVKSLFTITRKRKPGRTGRSKLLARTWRKASPNLA